MNSIDQSSARVNQSRLERLPDEMKLLIVNSTHDPQSIINLALTGPTFHRLVVHDEALIARKMLSSTIGSALLPIAIARHHAATAAWHRTQAGEELRSYFQAALEGLGVNDFDVDSVTVFNVDGSMKFINKFLGCKPKDAGMSDYVFNIPMAAEILRFHSTVSHYADTLSKRALRDGPRPVSPTRPPASQFVTPSGKESRRFCKALYIFQLVHNIFAWKDDPMASSADFTVVWKHFWHSFAPWENQQVRCVQQLLTQYFAEILTGGSSANNDNFSAPGYVLSQGLVQLRSIESSKTSLRPRSARTIFGNGFSSSDCAWHTAQDELWLKNSGVGRASLDVDHILSAFPDDDPGPQEAWYHTLVQDRVQSHAKRLLFEFGRQHQFECDSCLTKWAFVFWDREKVNWHAHGSMPTMAQMRDVFDISIPKADLMQTKGRGERGGCVHDNEATLHFLNELGH